MKAILDNIWVKRCVSVFASAYFAVVALLTYATFLYKLEFAEGMKGPFLVIYATASIFFLILMIYSRDMMLTRIISLLMMPLAFCLILLNMFNWALIVPPFIVALVMFFAAGTKENVKVIMGTIYLLLYALGIVAYFVLNMLLSGATETTIDLTLDPNGSVFQIYSGQMKRISDVTDEANTYSPDGEYRFYIADVEDSDKGSVNIYVVPANQDIQLKYFTLKQKGIKKTITKNGTRGIVPPNVGWIVETDETTGENFLAVLYQLTDEELPKSMRIRSLPDKNYFEFLGIT